MEYKYCVKEPNCCSEEEIEIFCRMVLKGGKVQKKGLYNRVKNCRLLSFCTDSKNKIIAVSSIKKPQKSYLEKIIKNANLEREIEDFHYEIGYSFTENEHRRKGLNGKLKQKLLNEIQNEDCLIFSTTAINSSQTFLLNNGFTQFGNSYNGKNDNNINYYERKFRKQ